MNSHWDALCKCGHRKSSHFAQMKRNKAGRNKLEIFGCCVRVCATHGVALCPNERCSHPITIKAVCECIKFEKAADECVAMPIARQQEGYNIVRRVGDIAKKEGCRISYRMTKTALFMWLA